MKRLTISQNSYLGELRVLLRKHHNQDTRAYKAIVKIQDKYQYTEGQAKWLNTAMKNYYLDNK